jgi:hypothetical protein
MPSFNQPWRPVINWNTPAGSVIDRFVEALPSDRPWTIIIFGWSPLQMAIDPTFLSGDVDVISSEEIEEYLRRAQLLKGQAPVYVEPCTAASFTASADWLMRAFEVQRKHVAFILPHPIDIMVSKIKRLEAKDLAAFRLVRAKTGHPTEEELILALRRVVDIYRPSFDEESAGNPRQNTQTVWREIFNNSIDVAEQIIRPALAERRKSYGGDQYGFREALGRFGEQSP